MVDKIKNLGNLPLVIILVIVVIIAIILSIFKSQNSEETNANTKLSDTTKVEELEDEEKSQIDQQPEDMVFEENVQEIVDETEEEEQNVDAKYFIRVNYGQNVVTIYTKDANGEYTVPYKAMVCSTGTATPRSGTYTMPSGTYSRGTWGLMKGNVWAQYFTRIKGSILFHSVPYTERNKWSLEYWEYDKLGTAASLGCIRLTVENAKWIYNNCPAGTQVEFYTDSNPGPLVPETPQKISEEEEVRGWDPTDPDATNPWKTYEPDKEEEPEETTEDTTTNKPTTTTKPNKKPTTTTTPEEETPETNQGGETAEPNEGNQSGENDANQSEENQNSEEVPEDETTEPNEGEDTVDEPETPPVDQEPSSGDENSSEKNTENNNEENQAPEQEIPEETQNTLVENVNSEAQTI